MKKMKKLIALGLVAASIFALAGCGSKPKMPEKPADIIAEMSKTSKSMKNFDADVEMALGMSSGGEEAVINMKYDMIVFTDPYKAKIDVAMDMGQMGNYNMNMYFAQENDKYYNYLSTGKEWSKSEVKKEDFEKATEGYTSQTDLDMYIANAESFKIKEKTKENDKEFTVLEGKVSGDAIKKIIEENGMMAQLGLTSMEQSFFDSIGDMDVVLTVDNATVLPYKISIDMTKMMQAVMEAAMKEAGGAEGEEPIINITRCTLDMTYNAIGTAEKFDIPKEALEAKETTPAASDDAAKTE